MLEIARWDCKEYEYDKNYEKGRREGCAISSFETYRRMLKKVEKVKKDINNCNDESERAKLKEKEEDILSCIVDLYSNRATDMLDYMGKYPKASTEKIALKAMSESEYAYFYRLQ